DAKASFKSTTRTAFRLCRLVSARAPMFIQYCSEASRICHEQLGFAKEKSVVIENGVDVDQFAAAEPHLPELSDRLPRIGTKIIGCIARLDPQKDHRTLFEAIARLKVAGKQVSLILAGHDCNPQNPRLRALLREFDIEDDAIPLGVISEVGRVL